MRTGDGAPYSHIFCTKDKKPQEKNWKSDTNARLPAGAHDRGMRRIDSNPKL